MSHHAHAAGHTKMTNDSAMIKFKKQVFASSDDAF